jgi:hypothetical protein
VVIHKYTLIIIIIIIIMGARGGAVVEPMVSLEFFIDIILLAALWPWGRLGL